MVEKAGCLETCWAAQRRRSMQGYGRKGMMRRRRESGCHEVHLSAIEDAGPYRRCNSTNEGKAEYYSVQLPTHILHT